MAPPSVSVIVPVYNGERYLAESIESILAQTHPPGEVIVVDDGSTDATPEIVARFGSQVRVLRGPNGGLGAARNRGIVAAGCALLAFLDADDLWLPTKLERQVQRFLARPEIDISTTLFQNFWVPEFADEAARYARSRLVRPHVCYGFQAFLVRRALFETVGGLLERRSEVDLEWILRAIDGGACFDTIPEVLVLRRLHQHNKSRSTIAGYASAILPILKARIDRKRASAIGDPVSATS